MQNSNNESEWSGHIIVCGLRNLGYRIIEQFLEVETPLSLVVIDNEPDPRFALEIEYRQVPLLRLDSRVEKVLLQASVTKARALIAVLDDLRNLETILEAKRLVPQLQVVASCSSPQVGVLIKHLPNCQLLNPWELTAPSFVNASLPDQLLHLFRIKDKRVNEEVAVVRDQPNQLGTISQLYGRIVPLQLEKDLGTANHTTEVCPSPNTNVQPQDRLYLIGRVEDMIASSEVGLDRQSVERNKTQAKQVKKEPSATRWQRFKSLSKRFFDDMGPNFRVVLYCFLAVLVSSIGILYLFRGENLPDALYLGLNLIIGQTIIDKENFWTYKIFGFLATLIGISLLGLVNAYITNYIVSARLAQILGQQKATNMRQHIVLVGLGDTSYAVLLGLLERGEQVVVIDKDDNNLYVAAARRKGVAVIHADARLAESLDLANISKARCLTIMANDDLVSLEAAANARERNPKVRIVMRMFDRSLADKVEQNLGVQVARSASALAAPYFVAGALSHEVITTFYVHKTPFVVTSLKVKAGHAIEGLSVRDLYTRTKILVLALRSRPTPISVHQAKNIPPAEQLIYDQIHLDFYLDPAQTILHAEDIIYFVGPYDRIGMVYTLNDQKLNK
jgi:Trk K+ transport system NAD-binding subunit